MELSTRQVSEISGASLRMIQHWTENNVIRVPRSGSGKAITWQSSDALEVAIVAALRECGAPLQTIRRSLRRLWAMLHKHITEDCEQLHPEAELILIVGGCEKWTPTRELMSIHIAAGPTLAVNILTQQKTPQLVIDLSDILTRVRNAARY